MNAGSTKLYGDFGSGWNNGVPYTTVSGGQARVPVSFVYWSQSDAGPYPIPPDAPIEAGTDHHVIVVDTSACKLYEMDEAQRVGNGWHAASGAVFDFASNALRPDTWTSADAAGLPIFPGLVRYDEVQRGAINHALRFTVARSQRGFIHPATHQAGYSDDPALPPMGLRVRLKSSFDTSGYSGASRVVLDALKRYGMLLADNGADWFITGAPDPRWNDQDLYQLKTVPANAFEVVQTGNVQR